MLELLIAVGAGVGGDLLAVNAQREIHLVEKTSDRVGRHWNVDLLENLRDLLRRLAGPLRPVMGSPAVSCSRRISMASIISGVFFPRACGQRRLCVHRRFPRLGLIAVVAHGPRYGDQDRESRPVGGRRHGPT